MPLINDEYRKLLTSEFQKILVHDVKLIVFIKEGEDCKYCAETVTLCNELTELNKKITCDVVKENDPLLYLQSGFQIRNRKEFHNTLPCYPQSRYQLL